jgi:hypothetical protein
MKGEGLQIPVKGEEGGGLGLGLAVYLALICYGTPRVRSTAEFLLQFVTGSSLDRVVSSAFETWLKIGLFGCLCGPHLLWKARVLRIEISYPVSESLVPEA